MLRVLRRHSPRHLEVAHLDASELEVWAARGYLRRGDLCAVPELGTVAVAELPGLAAPLKQGTRRDVTDVLVAASLATAAGLAVKLGGTFGGVASLPLVAAAHVWFQGIRVRHDASLETLPRELILLKRSEADSRRRAVTSVLKRFGAIAAIGASAVIPLGLFAKFGASAVTAFGFQRLFRAKSR